MTANALPTIAEAIHSSKSMATCARLLALAGLEEVLQGEGRYTVFAPTDLAFQELPPGMLESLQDEPGRLRATMAYHILCVEKRLPEIRNGRLATLEGTLLTALVTDDGLRLDHAKVLGEPVRCANGLIYEVSAVLVPGFTPAPTAAAQRQTEVSPWSGRRRPPRIPVAPPTTAAQDADALFQLPPAAPPDSSAS